MATLPGAILYNSPYSLILLGLGMEQPESETESTEATWLSRMDGENSIVLEASSRRCTNAPLSNVLDPTLLGGDRTGDLLPSSGPLSCNDPPMCSFLCQF